MTALGQVRHSFPAFRIFIFGEEVTLDTSTSNGNWTDGRAPGIHELVLASELDRYVMTPDDIAAIYADISVPDISPNQISSDAVQLTIDEAISENVRKQITDPVKRRIVLSKISERTKNQFQDDISNGYQEATKDLKAAALEKLRAGKTNSFNFAELRGEFLRFPFQAGQCVFHTGDHVRVFWRDPFNPKQWYFEASGFVCDWKEATGVNGKRTVTITIEDVLRLYRLARLSTNPALFDTNVSEPNFDALLRTWRSDNFTGLTIQELFFLITFGIENADERTKELLQNTVTALNGVVNLNQFHYSVNDKKPVTGRAHGVGVFNFKESKVHTMGPPAKVSTDGGKSFTPGPPATINSLGEWQALIDHAVPTQLASILTLAPAEYQADARSALGATSTTAENDLNVDDVISAIGRHPEIFPVGFGRLMMLLPNSIGPQTNRDILLNDFVQSVASQTEFATRLQIIYTICQRLDFSFYATPRGDVLCEFPLYSFRPEDFDTYADRYRYPINDTVTTESHFEDDKVKTLFIANYNLVKNLVSAGDSNQAWQLPGTAAIKSLIPQFGIRSMHLDSQGFLDNKDASAYYAYVKLSQANADAWVQHIQTVLHMGVGPNRPCWFESRDFIATTRSIGNSIVWGKSGSVNQSLKLNYRRGWSGQMVDSGQYTGKHAYESYGGRMSNPIDYSMMFQLESNKTDGSSKSESAREELAQLSDDQSRRLQSNINYLEANETAIAAAVSRTLGKQVEPRQIFGDSFRTPQENTADKGLPNSLHLSGLAVDIPKTKLDQLGITPAQMREIILSEQRAGHVVGSESGVILENGPNKDDANPDHVHFQLPLDKQHVQVDWKPGQAGGR